MSCVLSRLRVPVLIALALACPAWAAAQDQSPVSSQVPSPTPAERRPASEAVPQKADTADNTIVSLSLGCGGTADGAGPGDSRLGQNCGGSAGAAWLLRRGSFNVSGGGNQYYYSGDSHLTQFTFSEGASLSYQQSLRSRFTLSQSASRGFARQSTSAALLGVRLLAPTTLTQDYSAGGSYAYDVSRRTQFEASGFFSHISIGDGSITPLPDSDAAAVFGGGSTVDMRVQLQRQVDRDDSLGMVGEFSSGSYAGAASARTEALRASWRRTVGRTFSLNAEGGLSVYEITGSDVRFSPTAAVTVMRRMRTGALSVRFEQLIEVFGATHISRVFNPVYSVGFKRLSLSLDSTLAANTYPIDARANYKAVIVGAAAHYQLTKDLIVSASYSHWFRELSVGTGTDPGTYFSNVSLAYAHVWR